MNRLINFAFTVAVGLGLLSAYAQTLGPPAGGSGGSGTVTSVVCNGVTITSSGTCGALTGDVTSSAGGAATTLATVTVGKGGTGATTLSAGSPLLGNGTGAVTALTEIANNQSCTMFANCLVLGAVSAQEPFVAGNIFGVGSTNLLNVNWLIEFAAQNVIVMNAGTNHCWSSQTNQGGDASGLRAGKDTCFARNAAGVVEINNGTVGTLRDIALRGINANGASIIFSALASDATHTDATACVDSSTGQIYKGSGTIGICLGTSSARYKTNIAPLDATLEQVLALKPVSFSYRPGYGDDGARPQIGFIAEDVAQTSPHLVGLDADGNPNSVDMLAIVPMLVRALQEQQKRIEQLERR